MAGGGRIEPGRGVEMAAVSAIVSYPPFWAGQNDMDLLGSAPAQAGAESGRTIGAAAVLSQGDLWR